MLALLLLLTQCGGDDDPAKPAAATTAPTATAPVASTPSVSGTTSSGLASTGADQAGQAGTVVSGGDDLGATNAANLSAHDTEQAVGRTVRVQSVPADEGAWVGTSETDRLWVQLTGTRGESDYKVKQGDTVDFIGTVTRAANGFAAKTVVTAAEGAEQLTKLGYYVAAPASSVKLSN